MSRATSVVPMWYWIGPPFLRAGLVEVCVDRDLLSHLAGCDREPRGRELREQRVLLIRGGEAPKLVASSDFSGIEADDVKPVLDRWRQVRVQQSQVRQSAHRPDRRS